jgi:hypothetical protein
MTLGKVPRWESKLWSYISEGDGERCPLCDNCQESMRRCQHLSSCENCIFEISTFIDDESFLGDSELDRLDFLSCTKVRSIFQLAERLAQKYLAMGNVNSPPVPTMLIVLCDSSRAIEIHEVPLKVYHGAIWRLKDKWIIHLNENDIAVRRRFTLFHEAFHILAHVNTTPVFRKIGVKRGSFNELLADHFAGCILMPPDWVKEKWAEFHDIDKIVEIFEVPRSVAHLGLTRMGLIS